MSQSNFKFQPLVDAGLVGVTVSAALGTPAVKFTDADRGKPMKMGKVQNYVKTAAGDEIEGFLETVEPFTVNQGYSFGTVRRKLRVFAKVGANQGATAMDVLDLVVADVQSADGVGDNYAKVKTGTPTKFLWRVIAREGNGTAGTIVLLERE